MQLHLHAYRQVVGQNPLGKLPRLYLTVSRREQQLADSNQPIFGELGAAPFVIGAVADNEFHLILGLQQSDISVEILRLFPRTGGLEVHDDAHAWIDAAEYGRKVEAYEKKRARGEAAEAPKRDLGLETLAGVLKGDILVQNHCYRADEMAVMLDVGHEFGYKTRAFHHAVEAYKIADMLAAEDVCVATWATRWGFKMEAYDAIEENAAILSKAGACVAIHSDEQRLVQRLNIESAVALAAGRRAGIDIPQEEAIKWITINPARIMGIADRTGSLEPGKMADVVLWSRNPFSVYAIAEKVFIDGALVLDTSDPATRYRSDFEIGQPVGEE